MSLGVLITVLLLSAAIVCLVIAFQRVHSRLKKVEYNTQFMSVEEGPNTGHIKLMPAKGDDGVLGSVIIYDGEKEPVVTVNGRKITIHDDVFLDVWPNLKVPSY